MNKQDIEFIEYRIAKLKKDVKVAAKLGNTRRRHPAYKQIHGRLLELQYIKKRLGGK